MRFAWLWTMGAWFGVLAVATAAQGQVLCARGTETCSVAREGIVACSTPDCMLCTSVVEGVDAGVLDGGVPALAARCLDPTCSSICDECPDQLIIAPARPGIEAWVVDEDPDERCHYELCGHDVSLTDAPADHDADGRANCLRRDSTTAGSLLAQLQLGDCDGDGIANANEYRNIVENYACSAHVSAIETPRNIDYDAGRRHAPSVVDTTTCGTDDDCDDGRRCAGGVCFTPDTFSIEICADPLVPNRDGAGSCRSSGSICLGLGEHLLAPEEGTTSPPIEIPALCLPDNVLALRDCIGDGLIGGGCGRGTYTDARSYIDHGDCDRDGIENVDDMVVIDGQVVPLGCVPSIPAWSRDTDGLVRTAIYPYGRSSVCANYTQRLPDGGTVTWEPTPLLQDVVQPVLCAPPDRTLLGLARAINETNLACTHVGATIAEPGLCVYERVDRPAGAIECAYAQLVEGTARQVRLSCFDVTEASLEGRFHQGNCDDDDRTNLAEARADDGTPCGADGGVVEADATVEPIDGGAPIDANAPDAGPLEPDTLRFGGGACGCRASRPRRGTSGWVVAALLLLGMTRRRRWGS